MACGRSGLDRGHCECELHREGNRPRRCLAHTVAVNGRIVPVTSQHSLLEVARTRSPDSRPGSPGNTRACRFYVDHVEITNGLAWMGGTRAMDVDSLRMLSPTEAVTRFGGTARGGALLIFTRRN